MMLAQTLMDVSPDWLRNAVLFAAAIAAIIYYIKEIIGGKKKREVSFESEGASKAEFLKLVADNLAEHEIMFSKIGGVERGARENVDNKVEALRGELSSTTATMHELKGEMKQLCSQLLLVQQELQNR